MALTRFQQNLVDVKKALVIADIAFKHKMGDQKVVVEEKSMTANYYLHPGKYIINFYGKDSDAYYSGFSIPEFIEQIKECKVTALLLN